MDITELRQMFAEMEQDETGKSKAAERLAELKAEKLAAEIDYRRTLTAQAERKAAEREYKQAERKTKTNDFMTFFAVIAMLASAVTPLVLMIIFS